MERLSNKFLETFVPPAGIDIERPTYDRSHMEIGIVHLGFSNFAKVQLALRMDRALKEDFEANRHLGIAAVNLHTAERSHDLQQQNGLFTVVEMNEAGKDRVTIVGSVLASLYAPTEMDRVLDLLVKAKIVTLTITPDAHQNFLTVDGKLNLANPDILHDLDPANKIKKTVLGIMTEAIELRKKAGQPGFLISVLDNLEVDRFKEALVLFAEARPGENLAEEIRHNYPSPASMVDRIVPVTTSETITEMSDRLGYRDQALATTEWERPWLRLTGWVSTPECAAAFPTFAKLGMMLVTDNVDDYKQMKLRLLNGSHKALAAAAVMEGIHKYIRQDMADEDYRDLMSTFMRNEASPNVPNIQGLDVQAYMEELIARFSDTSLHDDNTRVAKDAPLPVILQLMKDQIEKVGAIDILAFTTACTMLFLSQNKDEAGNKIVDKNGEPFNRKHELSDALIAAGAVEDEDGNRIPSATIVRKMFAIPGVFGDIGQYPEAVEAVTGYLSLIRDSSIRSAINEAILNSNLYAAEHPTTPAAKRRPIGQEIHQPKG